VNPWFELRTGRTIMRPVAPSDLPDLQALKADARVFAMMLGGVRSPQRTAEELAEDLRFWAARGVGIWSVRECNSSPRPFPGASPLTRPLPPQAEGEVKKFLGIAGLMQRPDGRGLSLRFAFWPEARGRGLAREAAGAALRFAHERAGLGRVVAVAREDNFGSRMVLGAIGMVPCGEFERDGYRLIIHESRRGSA
jgi:RimJ/RimL family protein N-acetyltransferase